MRVLDISCGLGSISVGLAASVALGEFRGIDMEQLQIDVATSVDQEAGLPNALFQVADALDLPFPDNYYDAVLQRNYCAHSRYECSSRRDVPGIETRRYPGG